MPQPPRTIARITWPRTCGFILSASFGAFWLQKPFPLKFTLYAPVASRRPGRRPSRRFLTERRVRSQRPGAGWLEATRTHESLPTAAPTCDVQCWPPAGSCYCGLSQALPSRELIALSGLRCRADHFQQCVRTHMCTQHASRPCTQRCHHLRRCCTCLRGVRKWWSR